MKSKDITQRYDGWRAGLGVLPSASGR